MSTTRISFDAHAFCALPLVRRCYKALVVALSVFLVTLVALKQPFRGYLAESRLSGPTIDGLDLNDAVRWIKQLDARVAVVANPPNANSNRGLLRITYIAARPQAGSARVDDLAERWLYQYLPNRLQAHRQTALAELRKVANAARQREDVAHHQLESLRQLQLAQIGRHREERDELPPERPENDQVSTAERSEKTALGEKLATLRLMLDQLLGQRTDEHPQIKTLRTEIEAIEQQLGILPGQSLPLSSATGARPKAAPAPRPLAPQFVSASTVPNREANEKPIASLAAEVNAALTELSRASSERQAAEAGLSDRMHQLSSQATSSQWAKSSVATVSRLGGTPRCSTLTLAIFLAGMSGTVVFRAAAVEVGGAAIRSTTELATALELPVVGDVTHLRAAVARMRWRLLSPRRVRALVHLAEIIVAIAALACLLSVAIEPALARQVVADPFGTLSEVLGRFGV